MENHPELGQRELSEAELRVLLRRVTDHQFGEGKVTLQDVAELTGKSVDDLHQLLPKPRPATSVVIEHHYTYLPEEVEPKEHFGYHLHRTTRGTTFTVGQMDPFRTILWLIGLLLAGLVLYELYGR